MISAFEHLEGGDIQAEALEDLAYEAFEVCGFSRETIANNPGHFIVTYSDNIWCYFQDDDSCFSSKRPLIPSVKLYLASNSSKFARKTAF